LPGDYINPFMLPFNENDLRRELIGTYVQRGLEYQALGYVKGLEISPDGHSLRARVQGTARSPYRVTIQIARAGKRVSIRGNCTCPMAYNCKHVAAVLLEALAGDADGEDIFSIEETPPAAAPAAVTDTLVRDWLYQIARTTAPVPATATPERLLYLIRLDTRHRAAQACVEIQVARRLKDGGWGAPKRLAGGLNSNARYIADEDREIFRWLKVSESERASIVSGQYRLEGALAARILALLLATGRCFWEISEGPALAQGAARHAIPTWRADDEGRQRIDFDGEPPFTALLPLTPPWYVDTARHECGPLDTDLPEALAGALATAPSVEPGQAADVRLALQRALPGNTAVLPREFTAVNAEPVAPVPRLRLLRGSLALYDEPQWGFHAPRQAPELARLSFDYGKSRIAATDRRRVLTHLEGDCLMRITRDHRAEAAHTALLAREGFEPIAETGLFVNPPAEFAHDWILLDTDREQALLDFSIRVLPELRAAGWQIDVDADYPFRVASSDDWYADVDDAASNDWFGLELGVTVDGARVNLLPLLLDWLQHPGRSRATLDAMEDGDSAITRLPDGRLLPIPITRVRGVLETLTELYGEKPFDPDGRLRLSRLSAAELPALESALGTKLEWRRGEKLLELGRRLRDFAGLRAVTPPRGLNAELRPYQNDGLNWLQFLREYELGGVLADDMGLGKTVQALAHLLVEKEAGRLTRPALVVAPTSLMNNWRRECERFTPALKTLTLHGSSRHEDFARIDAHDVVFTTYPLLPRDAKTLLQHEFHYVILDEAQVVKNPKAKATEIVRQLKARHRLCLTGTPMENHLGELWSLFHFLMPGFLGDEREFRRLYRTPVEKHGDAGRRASLARRVKPFLLRRTKEQVAADLPPKTEIVRAVELDGSQRDLYESIRLSLHSKVREEIEKRGLARSQIVILDALLKLRQVCCDPRLLKLDSAKKVKQSAKLELLLDMLPELIEEGRRVLLFSQFTSMLALIEAELKTRAIPYVLLTGDTRDRATPIDRFQAGEVPLFLISLKAGGTGLNLTAADTVIHYDPWWNPAVERQATDRAHRIGQDKNVFVYKLITQGTVEEKIAALQARKQALADGLYGDRGADAGPAFSAADLDLLFAAPD
jgi:superfamily II DNA or RNA helicase